MGSTLTNEQLALDGTYLVTSVTTGGSPSFTYNSTGTAYGPSSCPGNAAPKSTSSLHVDGIFNGLTNEATINAGATNNTVLDMSSNLAVSGTHVVDNGTNDIVQLLDSKAGDITATFSLGATTGSTDSVAIKDAASNTGTGHLLSVITGSGSAAKPVEFANNGNGVEMSTSGALSAIGSGQINATGIPGPDLPTDSSVPYVPLPGVRPWGLIAANGTAVAAQTIADAASNSATPTAVAATTSEPPFLNVATTSMSGNAQGVHGNLNYLVGKNILFQAYARAPDQASGSQRVWIVITDTSIATMGASDTPTGNYVGFRYSTNHPDTDWQCMSSNAGSGVTVVDSRQGRGCHGPSISGFHERYLIVRYVHDRRRGCLRHREHQLPGGDHSPGNAGADNHTD